METKYEQLSEAYVSFTGKSRDFTKCLMGDLIKYNEAHAIYL